MKKIFLGILTFSIILLSGCNHPTKNESEIINFSYSYGSMDYAYKYNIEKKDEKIILTAKGQNAVDLNINKEINQSDLEQLAKIINDNGIYEWNGFNKRDKDIMDGYGFTLEIIYQDGKTLKAEGYMKYPKDYKKHHNTLVKYLKSLYE